MKTDFEKIVQGESFNEIKVNIGRDNTLWLSCMDGCMDTCAPEFNIDQAIELIEAINSAIIQVRNMEEHK
jgi:hypothetical protein